jgi:hypothetical protein
MPPLPFNARQPAFALMLVLVSLAVCLALMMQLNAVTRAQQVSLFNYGHAARRLLVQQFHATQLRNAQTTGSGSIGHGWKMRRYRSSRSDGILLKTDVVNLRVNQRFPKFHYTSVRIQGFTDEPLWISHIGAWP